MANAIPLLEGTNASGGYYVPDTFVQDAFQRGLDRRSAVVPLSQIRRVTGKRVQYTEYVGRPTAAFVAEGADKAATGAEYAQVTLNVKKIASIVMYTEELLEDAQGDPTVLVNQDVRAAFSDLIDSHALGQTSAGTLTTQFDAALRNTTQTVEYAQANQDALAKALSSAITTVEQNGYTPNGIILPNDAGGVLRDARDTTGRPLYLGVDTPGFNNRENAASFYGLPVKISTNLQTITGTAAAGRVVGIVGDFSHAVLAIRDDIRVKFSDQATVNVSGTDHRLWQENKVASLWETRVGFTVHDLNRAFVAIVNAA
jgi:HK97 family phage major capsid protein